MLAHPRGRSATVVQTIYPNPPITASKEKECSTRLVRSRPERYSKRKMELRSRRGFQTLGADLGTTTAITTANSLTPFLRLPQEIKNCIYELVLGGNLLHLKRDTIKFKRSVVHSTKGDIKEQRFTNQICCSQISFIDGAKLGHLGCSHSRQESSTCAPHRLDINLLRTSRQIYKEARFIPYSTNTFSFDTARNLRAFIHLLVQRSANVNQAIRSLHVDLAYNWHDLDGWTQAFYAVTQHMTLLERFYVDVNEGFSWPSEPRAAQKERVMWPVMKCLSTLEKTAPEPIMIVMSAHLGDRKLYASFAWKPATWTVEQKRLLFRAVLQAIREGLVSG